MDNARIHHAKVLNELKLNLNFFYNAPYSPMLNLIEEFFGLWIHYILKIGFKNRFELILAVYKATKLIKED